MLDPDTRIPAPADMVTSAPPVGACVLRASPLTLVVNPLEARLVGVWEVPSRMTPKGESVQLILLLQSNEICVLA